MKPRSFRERAEICQGSYMFSACWKFWHSRAYFFFLALRAMQLCSLTLFYICVSVSIHYLIFYIHVGSHIVIFCVVLHSYGHRWKSSWITWTWKHCPNTAKYTEIASLKGKLERSSVKKQTLQIQSKFSVESRISLLISCLVFSWLQECQRAQKVYLMPVYSKEFDRS